MVVPEEYLGRIRKDRKFLIERCNGEEEIAPDDMYESLTREICREDLRKLDLLYKIRSQYALVVANMKLTWARIRPNMFQGSNQKIYA